MKKVICVTVAAVILIFASACNRGSDDPHVGRWDAVSITALGLTIDVKDAFARETSLHLKNKDACTLTVDGESVTGEWSVVGGILRIRAGGQNFTGLIDYSSGLLILSLPAYGMDVNFSQREGKITPQPHEPEPEPPPEGWRGSEPAEWWYGEWFGYISINSVLAGDAPMLYTWDCFGVSNYIVDREMYIHLWDEGLIIGRPTFIVDADGGTGDRGVATANRGVLFEMEFEPGDWACDPEQSRYKDQFIIEKREAFSGGYVDYKIVLRPWGMLWDDVPDDERPPGYERYLDLYRRPLSEAEIPDECE